MSTSKPLAHLRGWGAQRPAYLAPETFRSRSALVLSQSCKVAIAYRASPGNTEFPRRSMAKQRSITSNLGLYVYGGAAVFLGLLGLVSGDFATTWQNVGPNVPLRVPLAYLTAVIELTGGIALLLPRTARAGALALTTVYSVFMLIWVPKALVNLGNYDPIGNVFEEFSLVAAGLVLCAIFSPAGSSMARRRPFFVLLFGICPISFGIVHIVDMPGLLGWIPGWLPPAKMFWAYATTIGFFAAAVAILTGISAPLAARLLTAEIVIFEFLVWIPNLSAAPKNHFNWAGNAICIALAGASWVVSDSISAAAKTKLIPVESPGEVSIPA
jgi:uncharacterized membrane protein YphA (DoxX/SURF4 family)